MKFSRVSDWLTDFLHDQFKSFANRSNYALSVIAIALFSMSLLSWKLLLAIAFGITLAWTIFEVQQPDSVWIHRFRKTLTQLWNNPSGKSIVSGSVGALLLLIGFGLADLTGRGWIAATLLLQTGIGVGLFAIWHQLKRISIPKHANLQSPHCDRYIQDLAHPTLMRRMIAIKRLQHLIVTGAIAPHEILEIRDYFQVLLAQESDAMIRLALQNGLHRCDRGDRTQPALHESTMPEFPVQVREISASSRAASISAAN